MRHPIEPADWDKLGNSHHFACWVFKLLSERSSKRYCGLGRVKIGERGGIFGRVVK